MFIEQWMLYVIGGVFIIIKAMLGFIIKYLTNHFKSICKDVKEIKEDIAGIKAEQTRQSESFDNLKDRMSAINGI